MNLDLVKTYTAGADIAAYTLVKFSADDTVVQAAAATDAIIGVCVQPGGAKSGERVDVCIDGVADVKMGGTVARGTPVTADSSGQGVAPAPSAGVNNYVIGRALRAAASGDITEVLIAPSMQQG
ncbi:MAG: capsid cement protein [Reyranellaceae bacterium]